MVASNPEISNLHAFLIGIDCYLPNRLSDGSSYKSLGGCVRDIHHVEAFLRKMRNVPDSQIVKLISSTNPDDPLNPLEADGRLPSRKNIIDGFRKLGEMAVAGEQVYIHYSGHGGRAKTIYPSVKGESGVDETLVPVDIGSSEGQYLRDLELARLLQELIEKNLIVTIVIDACHSGDVTRGDVDIRGLDSIDESARPMDEWVAPLEVLTATWNLSTQAENVSRGLKLAWTPGSRNYTLIAACRPNEYAYEYAFNRETKERNGALTYWLLDTLRQQNPGQTYKDLYDRINAKIHSQFPQQTPMLIGEGDRLVFGSELASVVYSVPVIDVQTEGDTVRALLAVGQAAGVTKGTEFAIYPRGKVELSNPEYRTAIARVTERGATESWCALSPIEGKELNVEQGDRAVLLSAPVNLVRKVAFFYQEEESPDDVNKEKIPINRLIPAIYEVQKTALERVKDALQNNGWVELAGGKPSVDDEDGIAYQVAVNNQGEYEIWDRTGTPFRNMHPSLKIGDPDSPAKLTQRLVHLAKYHAVAELDNADRDSPLNGKIAVEWLGTSDVYEAGDPMPLKSQLKPFEDPTHPSVKAGEYVFLSIRNDYLQPLNLAVLNLESDWSIAQIYPYHAGELFFTLDPGQKQVIPLSPSVEGEETFVENTVKVFSTIGAANFRWLELPSLDEKLESKGLVTRSGNPLDVMLAAIADEQPKTRRLSVTASPSREWTATQVLLTITG
jgi:Caspase domain